MHATKIHGAHTRITLQKTESNASPLVMKKKEWILRTDGETCGFSKSSQVSGLHNCQGCLGPWGWGLPWVRQSVSPTARDPPKQEQGRRRAQGAMSIEHFPGDKDMPRPSQVICLQVAIRIRTGEGHRGQAWPQNGQARPPPLQCCLGLLPINTSGDVLWALKKKYGGEHCVMMHLM